MIKNTCSKCTVDPNNPRNVTRCKTCRTKNLRQLFGKSEEEPFKFDVLNSNHRKPDEA